MGYGIHIIANQLIKENNPDSWWIANSLDNSTFLYKGKNPITTLEEELSNLTNKINAAFEKISKHISIRIGDYISIETEMFEVNSNIKEIKFKDLSINLIW